MPLIRFDAVSLKFGAHALLRETDFMIDAGERVCLIGRNGAGKTSMLRLVTGEVEPDSGEINMPSVIGISQLEQALPRDLHQQVTEFVAGGLDTIQSLCREYRERSQQALDAAGFRELQLLQDQIETQSAMSSCTVHHPRYIILTTPKPYRFSPDSNFSDFFSKKKHPPPGSSGDIGTAQQKIKINQYFVNFSHHWMQHHHAV